MAYPYKYSDLLASINARIHNKIGLVATPRTIINDMVTEVSNLQLRSSKKKAVLAPNLFNDIYQYTAPSDIDGNNLVGIQPQSMNRSENDIWELVTEEEFDQRKQSNYNLVAFSDHAFSRGLLISAREDGLRELSIAGLQGLTGDSSTGASWVAFGQATNLQTDNYNFIKGSGSAEFDIATGGSTAGLALTTVNSFDLTYYKNAGSVFTWAYINTVADVTNIKLRVGTSATVYYEMTATTANDATVFVQGWNLIRFDFNSKTTVGLSTVTACNYVALYFTLSSSVIVDTGYRFNWLNAKQGNISNLIYYSTNPWQTNAGTDIARSIEDSDYLKCDQDEYSLFVEKGVEILGMAAREYQDAKLAADRYGIVQNKSGMAFDYKRRYPTESLQLVSSYYNMGTKGINTPMRRGRPR